ncbi:MAG: 3,4-dihydroxy-2-butanone-4-phosphate synthase [Synergistales bacterium]|nr:3,4-dihydroxy-2-butanone-4-phosphate synthase [Dethiosulfovibrio sp.]NCC96077.1 3,4-dihydroxy-2-butanone-4-phosphate synthase [Synergistales bacterium]
MLSQTQSEKNCSIEVALLSLRMGEGVLVVDDKDREDEGDLIFSAQYLNESQMAKLIRDCSGIVCLCMTPEKAQSLDLSPMVSDNTSRYGTAFTVSIEAKEGVTTGVSAKDRLTTVRAAAKDGAIPSDLNRPGHVFPLVARRGGVMERRGHTEATVDLMRLAGLEPIGVLCELMDPDGSGTMAKGVKIKRYGEMNGYPVVSVEEIACFLRGR